MSILYWLFLSGIVFIGFIGAYEYTLYTKDQKSNAELLSKIYLFGMISMSGFGTLGLLLLTAGMKLSAIWSGFSVLLLLSLILIAVQYRMHSKMGLDHSPIRKKLL